MGARMACGTVSDLSGHLDEGIKPFATSFINALMMNLQDSQVNTKCKYVAIVAIGDLLCHASDECLPMIPAISDAYQGAAKNSFTLTDDEEEQETYTEL